MLDGFIVIDAMHASLLHSDRCQRVSLLTRDCGSLWYTSTVLTGSTRTGDTPSFSVGPLHVTPIRANVVRMLVSSNLQTT